MRVLIAAAAAVAMTAAAVPATAEPTANEFVFVKTDENGDFALSKGEVLIIAIRQFELADEDGDQLLEAEEVGEEIAAHAEFTDNDTDKSGAISIEEMIQEKLADFATIDANHDGFLTFDEIEAAYPQE